MPLTRPTAGLSRQQAYRITPEEDVLAWPYPRPAVPAGPNQRRRAKKLLAKQFAITKDSRMHCLIVTRKGTVVGVVPPWDL